MPSWLPGAARWPWSSAPPWSAHRGRHGHGRRQQGWLSDGPCRTSPARRADEPPLRGPRAPLAPGVAAGQFRIIAAGQFRIIAAVQVHRPRGTGGGYPMMSRCSGPSALSSSGAWVGACAPLDCLWRPARAASDRRGWAMTKTVAGPEGQAGGAAGGQALLDRMDRLTGWPPPGLRSGRAGPCVLLRLLRHHRHRLRDAFDRPAVPPQRQRREVCGDSHWAGRLHRGVERIGALADWKGRRLACS